MNRNSIVLIPDTNILYARNDVEVINSAFPQKMSDARKYAEIQLVIPRICLQEILTQKCEFAESHLNTAAKSLGIVTRLTNKPTSNIQQGKCFVMPWPVGLLSGAG